MLPAEQLYLEHKRHNIAGFSAVLYVGTYLGTYHLNGSFIEGVLRVPAVSDLAEKASKCTIGDFHTNHWTSTNTHKVCNKRLVQNPH
jgi:hypothetical protein